jgi:hypothetical protein
MGILTSQEELSLLQNSFLFAKYQKRFECESAREQLEKPTYEVQDLKNLTTKTPSAAVVSIFEKLSKNVLVRQIVRDLFKKLTQASMAFLKKK